MEIFGERTRFLGAMRHVILGLAVHVYMYMYVRRPATIHILVYSMYMYVNHLLRPIHKDGHLQTVQRVALFMLLQALYCTLVRLSRILLIHVFSILCLQSILCQWL